MQTAPSWLFSPLAETRWSTVLGAVLILAVISWRRNPFAAVVAVLAWLSAYEIAFNAIGVLYGWPAPPFLWGSAAVLGWVVLAAVRGIWPEWRLVVVYAVLMAVWVGLGYHSNTPTRVPFSASGEVLNEASKTALALAYLFGALRGVEKKELVKPLIDGDGATRVGGDLQFHRVGAGLNRPGA